MNKISITTRRTLFGFVFGLTFPVIGTLLQIQVSDLPINLKTASAVQANSPVLWIVDSAPLILGLIFRLVGARETELYNINKQYEKSILELEGIKANLEQRVSERTVSLEKRTSELSAANAVARSVSSSREIHILLPSIVETISEEFGFNHVGVYLLDEKVEYGFLQAASSAGGKRMLERGHQVMMSGEGPLQAAISKRSRQIARQIDANAARLDNPDLPETRARAVFPLLTRESALGILDLHSSNPSAFEESEVEAIQIVAEQLTLSIENARLFSDMQVIIQQMQETTDMQTSLSWMELTKRRTGGYQYTPLAVQKVSSLPERREESGLLSIPIQLRGQNIGRIHLKRKGGTGAWAEQEQTLAQEVAAQISLALENARLLEDAQARALRERSLSEIAARIGSAVDVESVLRTTIQELGKALGDSEVALELKPEKMD